MKNAGEEGEFVLIKTWLNSWMLPSEFINDLIKASTRAHIEKKRAISRSAKGGWRRIMHTDDVCDDKLWWRERRCHHYHWTISRIIHNKILLRFGKISDEKLKRYQLTTRGCGMANISVKIIITLIWRYFIDIIYTYTRRYIRQDDEREGEKGRQKVHIYCAGLRVIKSSSDKKQPLNIYRFFIHFLWISRPHNASQMLVNREAMRWKMEFSYPK